jgi:putative PIN family toxin of toxin-antitoxin system
VSIVLDTNVLISGILFAGPPARILDAWAGDRVQFVVSPEILEEYQRVAIELGRKYPQIQVQPILAVLTTTSEVYLARSLPEQICRDASDDKFLACALAARVNTVASGDKALLAVSGFEGIEVVNPKVFVESHLENND